MSGGTTIEAPCGVNFGEGCPLPSRLGGLGERRELPQQGPIYFYCIRLADILNCFESLYVLSEKKGLLCISFLFTHSLWVLNIILLVLIKFHQNNQKVIYF